MIPTPGTSALVMRKTLKRLGAVSLTLGVAVLAFAQAAWAATSTTMLERRYNHTSSLMPNGNILIVGGFDERRS